MALSEICIDGDRNRNSKQEEKKIVNRLDYVVGYLTLLVVDQTPPVLRCAVHDPRGSFNRAGYKNIHTH